MKTRKQLTRVIKALIFILVILLTLFLSALYIGREAANFNTFILFAIIIMINIYLIIYYNNKLTKTYH